MKVLIASKNKGKTEEIKAILRGLDIEVIGLHEGFEKIPPVIEDGNTYEENALKKAKTIHERFGLMTIADDSGLEVEALNGAPGVLSARFSGSNASDEDNIQKLLDLLKEYSKDKRKARFKAVIAIVGSEIIELFTGTVDGRIALKSSGLAGFGYDPVFIPEGFEQTFAQLGEEIKNRISHRAGALHQVKEFFQKMKH